MTLFHAARPRLRSPASSSPGPAMRSRSNGRPRGATPSMPTWTLPQVWIAADSHREARMVDMQIMAALPERHRVLRLDLADRDRRRAQPDALDRRHSRRDGGAAVERARSRANGEAKTIGLVIIFAYAFFKFAWSYPSQPTSRSLLGAMPFSADCETPEPPPYPPHRPAVSVGRPPLQPRQRASSSRWLSRLVRRPFVLIASTEAVIVVCGGAFASEARLASWRNSACPGEVDAGSPIRTCANAVSRQIRNPGRRQGCPKGPARRLARKMHGVGATTRVPMKIAPATRFPTTARSRRR